MVSKGLPMPERENESLAAAARRAYPELETLTAAAREPVYLVGGAVRDLLLDRGRSGNLDVLVDGDAGALAAALGGEPIEQGRFATARAWIGELEVDLASARSESYARPGALPDVTPGGGVEGDLERRDFTVNAMAISLEDGGLVDPHGGREDLSAGLLRVLHERSFEDDPTRALRAARYAARLGLRLEPQTETLLRSADLGALSADRRRGELLRIAAEPRAARAFELLAEWGLLELRPGGVELAEAVRELLDAPPWEGVATLPEAVLAAALGPPGAEEALAGAAPERPSEGVRLTAAADPVELVLARALGAEWLDRYLGEWRGVALEIGGEDLIAAGVPEGPAVGRGLSGALRRKLDGEIDGRDEELDAALEAAADAME
jgi:tRNA nucleotidyltransferase (CCA-adding enzyme)